MAGKRQEERYFKVLLGCKAHWKLAGIHGEVKLGSSEELFSLVPLFKFFKWIRYNIRHKIYMSPPHVLFYMELPPFVLDNSIFTLTNVMTRKGAMYDILEEYGSGILSGL